MQRLLTTAGAVVACASSALALRWSDEQAARVRGPGAHFQSLAGESFELNKLGEHTLLRAPPNQTALPLLRVSAHFTSLAQAPCDVYANVLTLKGLYFGHQIFRVANDNGTLQFKVSSESPAHAGKWKDVTEYRAATEGPEVMPDSVTVMPAGDGARLTVYAGPGDLFERPAIRVKSDLRGGLDISLSNLQSLGYAVFPGLLGTAPHSDNVEELEPACKNSSGELRKAATGEVENSEDDLGVTSTHLRNLIHEKFTMNQPGSFLLLRVPKSPTVPALLQVKGSFVMSPDAPCIVFLQRLTMIGTWFGNQTVHLSPQDETLNIKVSSPTVAGRVRPFKGFYEIKNGPEGLPRTVKITPMDGPAFKFQIGTGKFASRAVVLVERTQHGGLDIKVSHMERTQEPEIGGLLGTDKFPPSIERPTPDCQGKGPPALGRVKAEKTPAPGGRSVLTAFWAP